jgi:steroid delta-isomerase-like uncharacterized protein
MSEKENAQLAEQVVAAINARDFERYASLLDESYVVESEMLPGPIRGREAARQAMEMRVAAFPDMRVEIEQILTSGDYVVIRARTTGTHKGTFAGIAATNKSVNVSGCTVTEIRNGKAIRTKGYADNVSMLQQLGVLPLGKTASAG